MSLSHPMRSLGMRRMMISSRAGTMPPGYCGRYIPRLCTPSAAGAPATWVPRLRGWPLPLLRGWPLYSNCSSSVLCRLGLVCLLEFASTRMPLPASCTAPWRQKSMRTRIVLLAGGSDRAHQNEKGAPRPQQWLWLHGTVGLCVMGDCWCMPSNVCGTF